MKKFARVLSLLMAAALVFSGCGSSNGNAGSAAPGGATSGTAAPSGDAGTPATPAKDNLTVVIPTDVSKFSPYYTMTHADIYLVYQIYERLVYYKDGEVVPGLASSWDVSDDKKTIVFTLRDGATFHNGDKVTAEDVIYSFETNFARPSAKSNQAKFVSIEAAGENQVKIELLYPMESVYSILASPGMSIIDKAYVEANGDEAYMQPVGSGAYKLKSWNKGSSVELEAYEGFTGGDVPIKNVKFEVIPDQNTAVVALQTGKVDVILNASASNVGILEQDSNVEMVYGPSHTAGKLMMNVRGGVTMDQNLRQAIAYAIDRESMNLVAYEGRGQVSKGMYEDFLFYSGKDFSYEYNVDKAKECLAKTQYANGGLTITLKTSETYGTTVPQLIQQDLSKIGIDVKIESLEMNAHSQDYLSGNFELMYTSSSSIVPDVGEDLYTIYHSPENDTYFHAPSDGSFNAGLDAARMETDTAKKTAMYDEILQQVKDLAGSLMLVNGESNLVHTKGLKTPAVDANGMFYCYKDFSW